ncbi:hypothetical protein [Nocardioides sp. SYSU D00065]|uniref:hypothetical protein n=1 Tax=Nocardioides sp. SYSU D00065 TaxID=2817378 RepID=UPI001B335D84|nr:hypothetical protein [Nocardioides sp. SYSU D00065]
MDAPSGLDALAEELRTDGVVVDRVLGTGEAQEAHDRIAAVVREVPFPVYVALVEQPDGLPDDGIAAADALAGLLNRRLGDGLYVLETSDSIQQVYSFGLGSDPSRLSLAAYANADVLEAEAEAIRGDHVVVPPAVEAEAQARTAEELLGIGRGPFLEGGEYPATLTDAETRRLAERAVELAARADWRPEGGDYVSVRTASRGLSALVGVLSGLVVALLLGQTLRGWPRRRADGPDGREAARPALAPPPDRDAELARARELLDALSQDLERVDWARVRDSEVAGRALTARDAGEPLLESRDVADLIGAQVIARAGSRDLARGRRGSGDALRTCFFDPRHPEARASVSWRLGDGEVEVPCCTACAKRVGAGRTPDHLRLRARRGTEPYWNRDDVWARTGFGATSDYLARDVLADRAEQR